MHRMRAFLKLRRKANPASLVPMLPLVLCLSLTLKLSLTLRRKANPASLTLKMSLTLKPSLTMRRKANPVSLTLKLPLTLKEEGEDESGKDKGNDGEAEKPTDPVRRTATTTRSISSTMTQRQRSLCTKTSPLSTLSH